MTRWSPVKYARTADGVHLAYQEAGAGPGLLLVIEGFIPIDDMDEEPRLAGALQRLASFSHAVRFDKRSVGLSDPSPPSAPPTLEQWVDDAETILDTVGWDDALVFGDRGSALIAIGLAALRPARVRGLVLVNAFPRFLSSPDHPHGVDPAYMDSVRERMLVPDHPDGPLDMVSLLAPSAANDVRFRSWWERSGHRGASPATAWALRKVIESLDVREILPLVQVPTLVLHRLEAPYPNVAQGCFLAESIPGAVFVGLPGADAVWYVGDNAEMLDHIESFVTGQPASHAPIGGVQTVLLTDIVGSTALASSIGDHEWSKLFDAYEAAAHRAVQEADGEYVKSTGDGSLALFDGPVRAVDCAATIRDAAHAIGLRVRAGLHTGRVEPRGRDVAGIAIHVASRVLSAAGEDQILVTRTTAELLVGSTFTTELVDTTELRGVPGRWSLYVVSGQRARRDSNPQPPDP